MDAKHCSKCHKSKALSEFHKCSKVSDGRRSACKLCINRHIRGIYHGNVLKYREDNKNRRKTAYAKDPQKFRDKSSKYRLAHKDCPEFRAKKIISDKNRYHKQKLDADWLKAERERLAKWKRDNRPTARAIWTAYYSAKLQRTPKWADLDKIKEVYLNCPKGLEVDHIIPLQGKEVSGLHVACNLQYLTRSENSSKSNKFGEL